MCAALAARGLPAPPGALAGDADGGNGWSVAPGAHAPLPTATGRGPHMAGCSDATSVGTLGRSESRGSGRERVPRGVLGQQPPRTDHLPFAHPEPPLPPERYRG
jgi:hypothetical protein